MNKISIVIPCYKSSASLEIIVDQLIDLEKNHSYDIELILVNDSPWFLPTCITIEKLQNKYDFIRGISLRKNQGQHMALLVGMSRANGDLIITMDDDLQHPIIEIPKLINAINENKKVDAIFAVPFYKNKKHNLWRNLGSYVLNKVDVFFLKKPEGLIKSPFRILKSDLAKVITNNYNASPAVSSLIITSTTNIINIQVQHDKRVFGKSNYSLSKLISLSLNNVLHYSSLPLKIVGFIGFFGLLFSIILIVWVIGRKLLFNISFPGYTSTFALISFFGGLNLFSVGLLGEYLIRIIKEQQKPRLDLLIKE
jgi:glycosyltransferase involved in cell wall biosynthesis